MLCIITARGGSKRIPRKNIKDFLGKPIIAYAINAALESKLFSEENVRSVRPNLGLMPRFLPDVLGKKARRDIEAATPLSWDLVE